MTGELTIMELQPLLDLAEELRALETSPDIGGAIASMVLSAKTPSMAQSTCEHIMTMCHAKAWGDSLTLKNGDHNEGFRFLARVKETANNCGHAIFENNKKG